MSEQLLTPDRELITDQCNNTPKLYLGEPEFIILLRGVWVKSYLQEHRQLKTAPSFGSPPKHEGQQ